MPNARTPRNSRSPFFGDRNGTAASDSTSDSAAPVDSNTASTSTSEGTSPDLRKRKVGDSRKNATWRVDRELLDDFIQWCQARDYAQNLTIEEFMRRGMREVE